MTKNEQAARVKAMCEYLAGIGQPVSNVQGYELLARALGFKNKHVLASSIAEARNAVEPLPAAPVIPATVVIDGNTVIVRPADAKPLSYAEMVALDWQFDFVIAVPLDELDGDIERINDFSSKSLTGNESALESLTFTHVPEVNYGQGFVAYQVCAYVSTPEEVFEEAQEAADAEFYANLAELSKEIEQGARVVLRASDNPTDVCEGVISGVVLLAAVAGTAAADLFLEYATSHGANNDAVNLAGKETVFELTSVTNPDELLGAFTLSDLKYANKVATRTWSFSVGSKGRVIELRFR
jgi:hypothetical protein